jgi:hypothetical protein
VEVAGSNPASSTKHCFSCVSLKLCKNAFAIGNKKKMDSLAVANLALDLASVINFIALLLMLRAVIKNRKVLRGYSIAGSFLTFVSIVGFEVAYYLIGNIIGFALGWVTVAFWFTAFLYSLRQRLKGTLQEKEMVEP